MDGTTPYRVYTVHPHACGEYAAEADHASIFAGSSPRLWGVFQIHWAKKQAERFIPTPVGSITQGGFYVATGTVHPHACGEYLGQVRNDTGQRGSSPRLWGVLLLKQQNQQVTRFIPTPVGSIRYCNVESTPKSHLLIKQEVLNLKCEKAAGMQMYKKQKTGDRTDV